MAYFNREEMADLVMIPQLLPGSPAMTATREPKKVKFPSCMSEHAYCPAPPPPWTGSRMRLQDRYSHNARAVFYSGSCPICLEDPIRPPVIAFACGHFGLRNRFQEIGR
jgi:hypothetical protein